MKKITNAQQIIDIIEPIPAEKFITDAWGNHEGESCLMGHIHRKLNKTGKILGIISINNPKDYHGDNNGYGARSLTRKFLKERHGLTDVTGIDVNDSPTINGYTEPVIKDRVMHMLKDMVEAGY